MRNYRSNANSKNRGGLFYGWIIVALSALGLFFSGPGQTFSISIFIDTYIEQFGWSRALVSGYYSVATLTAGLTLPMVGRAIDTRGHRIMMSVVGALLGLTALWMSFISAPWMLFVGFLFLRLLGQGSMTLLPQTLVPQWFTRTRGRALSLMSLGIVISSSVLPPLNNWMIASFSAAFAWRVWASLLFGVMVPAAYFFVKDKPEEIDEIPDGRKASEDGVHLKFSTPRVKASEYPWTVKEAMGTRSFWLMLLCMVIPSMVNTGITFHLLSIIGDKGFTNAFAALLLSITAMVQFPMTFVAGQIVDRFQVHHVKGINYLLYFAAVGLLLIGGSRWHLVVYAVLMGLFMATDSVSTGVLWPNYYGRKYLGSIRGITMTAVVIGSALGPLPLGIARDSFGGYSEILTLFLLFPALGSLAAFLAPHPKEPEEARNEA